MAGLPAGLGRRQTRAHTNRSHSLWEAYEVLLGADSLSNVAPRVTSLSVWLRVALRIFCTVALLLSIQ